MALTATLMLGSTTVSYAYEGDTSDGRNQSVESVSEEERPLETVTDGAITPYSGYITELNYTSTTGTFGGRFTVPASENGSDIRVHWRAEPQNEANAAAIFQMTVTGNGVTRTVLLPCNTATQSFSIGALGTGTYSFTVRPYRDVSGTYLCFYRYYAF